MRVHHLVRPWPTSGYLRKKKKRLVIRSYTLRKLKKKTNAVGYHREHPACVEVN